MTEAGEGVLRSVSVEYEGLAAPLNHRPMTAALLSGLLTPLMAGVNMVNAPMIARERGLDVAETVHDRPSEYQTLVRLTVTTDRQTRSVAGPMFCRPPPPVVVIKGLKVEGDLGRGKQYGTHPNRPGFIGRFGATLANADINIATFHLGRAETGGDAICLVSVDQPIPDAVLAAVRALPLVMQATPLEF